MSTYLCKKYCALLQLKRSLIEQAIINFSNYFGVNPFFHILSWWSEERTNKSVICIYAQKRGIVFEKNEKQQNSALQQNFCVQLCVMERKNARKQNDLMPAGV